MKNWLKQLFARLMQTPWMMKLVFKVYAIWMKIGMFRSMVEQKLGDLWRKIKKLLISFFG